MTDVREINHIEELAEYRSVWRSLLAQTRGASFFQSLEWLEAYWKHYGAGQELRVLIVSSSGEPVGILPLVVRSERTKVGPLRMLTYPLHDWGSFYGPIGEHPEVTLAAGLEHVRRTRCNWAIVELRWVDADGIDRGQTEHALRHARFQAYKTVWNRTAVVNLPETWEAFLAGRTSKWRNNLRRWQRKLAERGEITYLRYRPRGESHGEGDPRWDLYDACEELASRSWQGSSETGTTLSHESVRPFLRDVHALAANSGALDINLLWLDGEPLAFAYNYHYAGSIYGLRVGYDARQSRDGVGNILYVHAIRDSIQRGDHTYDMGVGSLEIKRYFLTQIVPIYRFSHYRLTAPRAQVLRLRRWRQQRLLEKEKSTTLAAGV